MENKLEVHEMKVGIGVLYNLLRKRSTYINGINR